MKLNPKIEKVYRPLIRKSAIELRAVLDGYFDCYDQLDISKDEMNTLINGTVSGTIGYVSQSFDKERCKHIFELALKTKEFFEKTKGT